MMWFVYFVMCADNTLYCGATNNVQKRIDKHNSGKGAKYTSRRLPVRLSYVEACACKSDALKLEYRLKQLSRKQKDGLINEYNYREKRGS